MHQATKGISDLINKPGKINLDFADVTKVMKYKGDAIMGTGIAHGEERAVLAAQQAINSPLLQDVNIKGAKGLLINITGPKDMSPHEMNDAAIIIQEEAGDDADIISGIVTDSDIKDEIKVTVIATGINDNDLRTNINNNPLRNLNVKDDVNVDINDSLPTYKQKELESNNKSIEINDNNENTKILSFGDDDLDIPAFIRNRKSIN